MNPFSWCLKCRSKSPTLTCLESHRICDRKDFEVTETLAVKVSTQSDEAIGKLETLLEDLDSEKEELKIKFKAVEKQIK